MVTSNFCIDSPKDMFKQCIRPVFESCGMGYPDENNEEAMKAWWKNIEKMWDENEENILTYLDNELDSDAKYCIDWNDEYEVAELILHGYIKLCKEEKHICIDVETYWKDLMIKAMGKMEEVRNCTLMEN